MADSFSIEERSVPLAAGALTWLEAGRGEAFALLHGIGSRARSFEAQLEGLGGAYRVLAWNAPGYGGSARLAGETPAARDYADVLRAWLDALGIERLHLLGHSLGALMAARFAAEHPRRILSLTLASCALGHANLPAPERAAMLNARLADVDALGPSGMAKKRARRLLGPKALPAHIESVTAGMAAVDARGYGQAARMLSGGDLLADIAALGPETPLQIVYGTADVITPPAANLRAAAARAGTHVESIEDAGHAVYVEAPEEFNRIARDFAGRPHGRV